MIEKVPGSNPEAATYGPSPLTGIFRLMGIFHGSMCSSSLNNAPDLLRKPKRSVTMPIVFKMDHKLEKHELIQLALVELATEYTHESRKNRFWEILKNKSTFKRWAWSRLHDLGQKALDYPNSCEDPFECTIRVSPDPETPDEPDSYAYVQDPQMTHEIWQKAVSDRMDELFPRV